MIEVIEKHVQAVNEAYDNGVIDVRDNTVQLKQQTFKSLVGELKVLPDMVKRQSKEYPFEFSFIHEGLRYFSLYKNEEVKKQIRGNINAIITRN